MDADPITINHTPVQFCGFLPASGSMIDREPISEVGVLFRIRDRPASIFVYDCVMRMQEGSLRFSEFPYNIKRHIIDNTKKFRPTFLEPFRARKYGLTDDAVSRIEVYTYLKVLTTEKTKQLLGISKVQVPRLMFKSPEHRAQWMLCYG